jgi:hypothetical protein
MGGKFLFLLLLPEMQQDLTCRHMPSHLGMPTWTLICAYHGVETDKPKSDLTDILYFPILIYW